MPLTESKARTPLFLVAILLLAFYSYAFNGFKAASGGWFETHQLDSEQLVLDGLLHADDERADVILGNYTRPGAPVNFGMAREFYARDDTAGAYLPYESQFGLQLRAFHFLRTLGMQNIAYFHALTALLMSAVVTAMVWCVRRDVSFNAALGFGLVFVFSPWLVVFARNLYWVSFTWYVPLLLTMWLAPAADKNRAAFYGMLAGLFIAYLVKLLCGYEYLTSIFIAACVPIVYQCVRHKRGFAGLARRLGLQTLVFLSAFGTAVIIHSISLDTQGVSGLSHVLLTAQKRVASSDPKATARQVCGVDPACEKLLYDSLVSNPVKVVARYFWFRDFLPWTYLSSIDQPTRDYLHTMNAGQGIHLLPDIYKVLGIRRFLALICYACLKLLPYASFFGFLVLLVWQSRVFSLELRLANLAAFMAPLSWFIMAKAHSQIHYHINYVLWYMPFVPAGLVALLAGKQEAGEPSRVV